LYRPIQNSSSRLGQPCNIPSKLIFHNILLELKSEVSTQRRDSWHNHFRFISDFFARWQTSTVFRSAPCSWLSRVDLLMSWPLSGVCWCRECGLIAVQTRWICGHFDLGGSGGDVARCDPWIVFAATENETTTLTLTLPTPPSALRKMSRKTASFYLLSCPVRLYIVIQTNLKSFAEDASHTMPTRLLQHNYWKTCL